MWSIRLCALGLVLSLTAVGTGRSADPGPDEKTGPKVGSKALTFVLKDQSGKERTLDEFLQRGKVALVFYRSASW